MAATAAHEVPGNTDGGGDGGGDADSGSSPYGARTARQDLRGAAASAATLALLAAGYVLQLLGTVLTAAVPLVVGAVAGVLADALLMRRRHKLARRLGRAQLTAPVRQLVRDGLFLGGLASLGALRTDGTGCWLLTAVLVGWVLHFLCQAVAGGVRTRRRLPFVTRNIDVAGLGLTGGPPRLFVRQGTFRLTGVAVLATGGMTASAATGNALWAALVTTCCCAGLLAGTAYLATWLLPRKRVPDEATALEWLDGWLAAYRPTVGMYFSGGTTSAYQANMWLSTLAELDGRPVIVLRERFMVQKIDATDVPIVCIPKVAHLMHLEHSTLKVLLHPANSGKTSQVLRIPTLKHAFINHGESDKLSSCNPYAKAYDEVWVAGEAARERYRLADIGVDDRHVVEVGRPQLSPILPAQGPPSDGRTTVLYAPTWEGWTDDPGNTSVILAGEAVVRTLLADDKVRLLYKPHPMTGSVDPRAGAADQRIRALIAEANETGAPGPPAADARSGSLPGGPSGAPPDGPEGPDGPGRPGPAATAALERATAELDLLTRATFRPGADEIERMLQQGSPEPGHADRVAEATAAWEEAFWAATPRDRHQVITGPRPGINTCFNQADLLISDVSSVVSDFLASQKPYAVANTTGLPEEEFRAAYPTVRAATILPPDAARMPELLESVRRPERDTLAPARRALKVSLLGPAEPPSLVRFNQAVLDLAARAGARNAGRYVTADEGAPVDAEAEIEAEGELRGSQELAEALGDDDKLF